MVLRSEISQASFPDSQVPAGMGLCDCVSSCLPLKLRAAEPACDTPSGVLCFGPAVGATGQVVGILGHG